MNKKTAWIIGIIVIVILLIVGLSNKDNKNSNNPVKVGALLMLTGPTAHLGQLQQNAINLAVEKINADGGINGRSLEIISEDAGYDPKQATNAYQALKLKGIKNYIIDGSPIVSAIRKSIIDDGNFGIAGVATAPAYFDGQNRTCRIALTAKTIGPALSELAIKDNYKKVALLLPDNEAGRGLADEFTKSFSSKGGQIVISEFYNAGAGISDFRTNILKVKSAQANIDAIILSQVLNNAEAMLRQVKELGITKPILSEFPTITNPALKDLSLVEGIEFIDYEFTKGENPSDSDSTVAFKKLYQERYNDSPIYFTAAHYDVTLLLAKAIAEVGEDPQKIADYVSSLKDYKGITGTYSFNDDCEVSRPTVTRVVKAGKFEVVK